MKRSALILLIALGVAASPDDAVADAATVISPPDPCGAVEFVDLVGRDAASLERLSLPEGTRVLGPNDLATADFLPERLNITLGEDDRIRRVRCG